MIGKLIRIDPLTITRVRGNFAGLAVDIDLNKPLVSIVRIEEHLQKIEYEGLHSICFECGKFGHKRETCSKSGAGPAHESVVVAAPNSAAAMPTVPAIPSASTKYGDWMMVQRKRGRPRTNGVEVTGKVTGKTPYSGQNKGGATPAKRNSGLATIGNKNNSSRYTALTTHDDALEPVVCAPFVSASPSPVAPLLAAATVPSEQDKPPSPAKNDKVAHVVIADPSYEVGRDFYSSGKDLLLDGTKVGTSSWGKGDNKKEKGRKSKSNGPLFHS